MIGSNKFDVFFRSFTYIKNSIGPSIEPCGTPHVIVSSFVYGKVNHDLRVQIHELED